MGTIQRPPTPEGEHVYDVEWTTISYRTIAFYAILALLLAGFVLYLIAPNTFARAARKTLNTISAGMMRSSGADATTTKREAHFVNIDGTVRIKKARSLEWIPADYNTSLEKGDFVQTGSTGVARIIFADGTNYILKPDALIVVEESREDPVTKATRVAVQVTSGAVDLSTGRFEVPGSTSQVAFADAVANLSEESRAAVRNDPRKNIHEFTVNQGQAEVTRGSTSVRLGRDEQVTLAENQAGLIRNKVIAPPAKLLSPVHMGLRVSTDPRSEPLEFAWTPVSGAVTYHLQVSPSGMFSNVVIDKKVNKNSIEVTGLDEGIYYWTVTSIDAKGVESQPSMANRFNLVQQVGSEKKVYLEIIKLVQHGRVMEVEGRTEPGSTVIINNEQVFNIAADGRFTHYTSPLPSAGLNQITITAQNRKGDMNTIRKSVVVE